MAHFVAHLSWKDFYESPNTVEEFFNMIRKEISIEK